MKTRWIILFIFVGASFAIGCRNGKDLEKLPPPTGPGAPPRESIPKLAEQTRIESADTEDRLVVTGTTRPIREAKIGPRGSGMIVSLPVEEGDRIKKGQLLFRLEDANQTLAVSQAEAALSGALVAESTAGTEKARIQALYDRGSVSPAALDAVDAQLQGAQAAVKQARAAVARARQATVDTSIRAPIDGVVAKRLSSVGDTVTMMPPTVVLIVQDISSLEIRGNVPETMLKHLRPGSALRVRFPAVEVERDVTIERINPSVDPMTRTVEVVAVVPNADSSLKAGMLVELDFVKPDQTQPVEDKTKKAEKQADTNAKPAGA